MGWGREYRKSGRSGCPRQESGQTVAIYLAYLRVSSSTERRRLRSTTQQPAVPPAVSRLGAHADFLHTEVLDEGLHDLRLSPHNPGSLVPGQTQPPGNDSVFRETTIFSGKGLCS